MEGFGFWVLESTNPQFVTPHTPSRVTRKSPLEICILDSGLQGAGGLV